MSSTKIDSLSQESRSFPPSLPLQKRAYLKDLTAYQEMYRRSLEDPNGFWGEIADSFFWFKKWDRVHHYNWKGNIDIRWFEGGKTNICYNALDRHLPKLRDRTAFLWVGNEPGEEKRISYQELWEQVGRAANMLKSLGVKKGDRIAIYMPMIPELPVALLACARIGAIHSVIFGGFSAESLKDRIVDAGCRVILTSDGGFRGPKKIPMKTTVDEAIELSRKAGQAIDHCLVVRRTGDPVPMKPERDLWWHEASENASIHSEAEVLDAEEPLFILYTSGSTGKPKGVLHTTAGYMIYAEQTFKYVFDYHPEDLFWCTADIGWVTGHSYIVYGPLLCGASCILFEGVPNYPHPDRFWEIIERYKVNTFYTAPTAIRALMREGDDWPKRHDLSSLKILGTVGEPINPEAWIWYYEKIGGRRCPVVDTWWQTETGGILITPLPGAMPTKPGSASLPFFGVEPAVLREDGTECETNEGGLLVLKRPWPGIMRTVYGHHERFKETYFSRFPGVYFTGDGARRDEDGYYWLMGRIDDVLNVSGHRIGTAEVESALVSHPSVAEAAVVGFPHEIKGQGIHAYVILKQGFSNSPTLQKELIDHVRKEIGPTAKPDRLQFAPGLPKTRSGKIMRRILRKIAEGKPDEVGDVTTLADPHVVHQLLSQPLEISYDV
ncbi:MAG: acetate--CoA ligase [Deltaproteobacteria bacterium]|nr:acetate--CoA ligase [Deltaproteobacteria bacterium]